MLVRYEDLVLQPRAFQTELASFLDLPNRISESERSFALFDDTEWWKSAAEGPVDLSRRNRWETALTGAEVDLIERIVRPEMLRLGYRSRSTLKHRLGSPRRLVLRGILCRRRLRERKLRGVANGR